MKKLFIGLTLVSSFSSFAGECLIKGVAPNWTPKTKNFSDVIIGLNYHLNEVPADLGYREVDSYNLCISHAKSLVGRMYDFEVAVGDNEEMEIRLVKFSYRDENTYIRGSVEL